jgi:hypothetical protein
MNLISTRILTCFLVLCLSVATEPLVAQTPAQNSPAGQSTLPPVELPDNPGHNSPSAPANTPAQQQPPLATQPSGTAAAPSAEVSGGAASKPAGVALAPPKQRQIRSLLIKLGFLAGAGVALGTVIGLSAASPGHVPGSGH